MANVAINVEVKSNGEIVLGKLGDQLQTVEQKAKKSQTAMQEFAESFKSGLGVGAGFSLVSTAADMAAGAIRGMGQAIKESAKWAEDLGKATRITGLSSTAYQQLETSVRELGITMEGGLTVAVVKMQKAIADGNPALEKMGLTAQSLSGLDTEAKLKAVATAVTSITDPAAQTTAAMALFGESGAKLIPLLDDIASGSYKMNDAIGDGTVKALQKADKAIDEFETKWERFKKLASGAAIEFGSTFAALMQGGAGVMNKGYADSGLQMSFAEQEKLFNPKFTWTPMSLGDETPEQKAALAAYKRAGDKAIAEAQRQAAAIAKAYAPLSNIYASFNAFDLTSGIGSAMDYQSPLADLTDDILKLQDELGPGQPLDDAIMQGAMAEGLKRVGIEADKIKLEQQGKQWAAALQGVALMAGAIGGALGDTVQVMGQIGESFKGWKTMTSQDKFNAAAQGVGMIGGLVGQRNRKTGGAIQGAAGGAMAGAAIGTMIMPGVGTVVGGVIGGVVGGVAGWLGGKKKEKEEKKALEEAFYQMEDGLKKQFGSLAAASGAAQKYGVSLKWALDNKNAKSLDAALKDLEKRMKGLETATQGVNQLIDNLSYTTQEELDKAAADKNYVPKLLSTFSDPSVAQSAGNLFAAQFWAVFQRQGIAGLDAMRPQWSKLLEEMTRQGLDPVALGMGRVGRMMDLTNDPKMRALLGASQGTSNVLSGAMDANYIDKSMLADANNIAQKTFEELQNNGMTAEEAAQASEAQLATLAQAFQSQGEELPQWLQDAMAAAGMELLPSQLDVLKESRDYLKKMAGASGYADGGIVTRPQLAWVGERGPEAVIPIGRPSRMSMGGGTNITIARSMGVTRETEYAFDRRVERVVSRALRQNGRIRRDAQVAVNGGR